MKSFVLVHNIMSPYRIHLFSRLSTALDSRGYRLTVHFMSAGHRDRPSSWREGSPQASFQHRLWPDRGFVARGKEWHLNPGLAMELLRRPPDILMVGGPWDSLTGPLVSVARARVKIAWVEGNMSSPGRNRGFALALKRSLLGLFDMIAVPGAEGRRYAEALTGIAGDVRVFDLPNVVDERRFRDCSDPALVEKMRVRLGAEGPRRLALWPARLIPAKGIAEFLAAVEAEVLAPWAIAIIGEGPERERIESVLRTRGLERSVRIFPYMDYKDMPLAYAAANMLLLPSRHDPNPLSVVEGLHSGLPVLISNRLGNCTEAVDEGRNGWVLDPMSQQSIHKVTREAFTSSTEALERMGRNSRCRAEYWTTDRVVANLVERSVSKAS